MSCTPPSPPPPPRRPASRGKIVAIACICLGAGGLVGGVIGFAIGIAAGSGLVDALQNWDEALAGPENIEVTTVVPDEVRIGQTFQIDLEITNTGTEVQELNGIDIYTKYLDGFEVIEVSPAPARREDIGTFISYYFYQPIQPGEKLTVTFQLRAEKPGTHSGDADVCINTEYSFVTQYLKTKVTGPAN